MQISEVHERIDKIRDALAWSLHYNEVLSVGERMLMNQERAMWLRELEWKGMNPDHLIRPGYRVPKKIEEKIRFVTGEIQRTGWNREEYEQKVVTT